MTGGIKGALFLFLPYPMEAEFFRRDLAYPQLFYVYMAITLILGLYLTYGGFTLAERS